MKRDVRIGLVGSGACRRAHEVSRHAAAAPPGAPADNWVSAFGRGPAFPALWAVIALGCFSAGEEADLSSVVGARRARDSGPLLPDAGGTPLPVPPDAGDAAAATVGSSMSSDGPSDGGVGGAVDGGPGDDDDQLELDQDRDSDGDGVVDREDRSPSNPNGCGDRDGDTCDDCSTGRFAPDDDGADSNGDGICDACDVAICSAQGVCSIEAGRAVCSCSAGWTGESCKLDVDECTEGDNPCRAGGDAEATCTNIRGDYVCSCGSLAFSVRGGTCAPIAEGCEDESDGCQDDGCGGKEEVCADAGDEGATCVENDAGVRACRCSPGVGGMLCEDFQPSCRAILEAGLASGDGTYLIDPFGGAPFAVTCDMTTDGGGWTGVTADVARNGFHSQMTAVADGACDFNGDHPRATSRVETVVCRYDMDLGFPFERLRLLGGQVTVRSDPSDPNELAHNSGPWGTADCVPGDSGAGAAGDVRIGAAASSSGALSLAAAHGLSPCSEPERHDSGTVLSWSGRARVEQGSVLRLEMSESGGVAAEGWEWTRGTVFVR